MYDCLYYFMRSCKKEARTKGKTEIIHNCQLESDAVCQKSRDFMKANYTLQSFMLSKARNYCYT